LHIAITKSFVFINSLTMKNQFTTTASKIILALIAFSSSGIFWEWWTQAIAQPSIPVAQAPTRYGESFGGTVDRYLLNPEGIVDGLLLEDGLQVKFPPHMGERVTQVVEPGNRITVNGVPGVPVEWGQEVRAYQITNAETQETIVDQPPAYPPRPPVDSRYETLTVTGTADHWLVGRRGEIKGIVLSSGAQIKFPPHVGYQLTGLVREGAAIQAEGFGSQNSYGQVIEATSLIIDGQPLAIGAAAPVRR
jgi:hypothetical protein